MRIGIEATALTRRERTGVDNYTLNLCAAMAEARPDYRFELGYFWSFLKGEPDLGLRESNVEERGNRFLPSKAYRILYRLGAAPRFDALTGMDADFVFFPNFVRWPIARGTPSGIVVHDLSYIHSRATLTKRHWTFLERKVPRSIAASDIVFTPSGTIRRELLDEYGTEPSKVVVASPAADLEHFRLRTIAECAEPLRGYGLAWRNFVLFVGTIEPRKNIGRLLEAYTRLPEELRRKYPLALAGAKGWVDEEIRGRIAELQGRGLDIRQLGYVPYTDLPRLYSAAAAFVFPSTYEGFGMPVLEALACGAAVLTSSCSSLPEVAGDAALLVDPLDTDAICAGLEALLTDEALSSQYREAGPLRARRFSWSKSAEVVLGAIEGLAQDEIRKGSEQ